ncbi:transposable element Tcb1 transposase [Trichonephila clavipes]|uniref:Transposable element Tcb1 transposase n=1 Tax=Trichonephila clavipes TaxID=2585209 RepID=A0A8X6S023_TRICX|nr:transposable element Tcb1 transposase [Trichonephila clavipes]
MFLKKREKKKKKKWNRKNSREIERSFAVHGGASLLILENSFHNKKERSLKHPETEVWIKIVTLRKSFVRMSGSSFGMPPSSIVDGFRMPHVFSAESFRSARQYQPRPDDVFIITYPKCGTTWAQQIIFLIYKLGEPCESSTELLGDFPFLELRGRIIGKLEEGRSVTSVAAEFGIAHSIVSRLWRQFQTTGTAIRGFSSGHPRGTTPADDRYIILQAKRNRRQTVGEIARHTTQATGRPISRFTVARRLHGGGLFARRPVRCVPLTPAHRRRHESRFSLSCDSHRTLIWRERGSRNHPSNIIERDRYGGRGVLVWGGIMLGSRTDLHIFDAGSVNETRYCNEILLPYVRLFRGAMGLQFFFIDDNAPCHRTVAAEQLL